MDAPLDRVSETEFGAVEVYNEKEKRWDDTAFVLEDGAWKLAVGDQFKGSYQSPGKGQAQLEMDASNPMNDPNYKPPTLGNMNNGCPMTNTAKPPMPNVNANANSDAGKKEKVRTAEVPLEKPVKNKPAATP